MNRKGLITFGFAGAAFTAFCCFTPILVGLLGFLGLGAVTGYLDYVLFPALAGFLGLTLYGLSRRNRKDSLNCCVGPFPERTERIRRSLRQTMTEEQKPMTSEAESHFEELRRLSPKVTGGLVRMRQEAYRDATVAAKYKLLTAMAISIAIRCEPCIRAYVRMACAKGISKEEFIEFLEVAMTMQGCPGEEWALKAWATYKEYIRGDQPAREMACCSH